MIDGSGIGHVGDKVLKDRRDLSREGVIVIALTADNTGKIVTVPKIISKGFILVGNEEIIYHEAGEKIKTAINNEWEKNSFLSIVDIERIGIHIFTEFAYKQTKRRPIIIPAVQQISGEAENSNNEME